MKSTVYRQRDARFLSLLEHIRHRRLGPEDERLLRERYDPHSDDRAEWRLPTDETAPRGESSPDNRLR